MSLTQMHLRSDVDLIWDMQKLHWGPLNGSHVVWWILLLLLLTTPASTYLQDSWNHKRTICGRGRPVCNLDLVTSPNVAYFASQDEKRPHNHNYVLIAPQPSVSILINLVSKIKWLSLIVLGWSKELGQRLPWNIGLLLQSCELLSASIADALLFVNILVLGKCHGCFAQQFMVNKPWYK